MLENRTAITAKAQTNRAAITNDPLVRADGRTPQGRRLRDLYRAYLASLGNPVDTGTQAAILAAAELVVAAEAARSTLLAGGADVDQVVRLENLAHRSLRRLGIRRSTATRPPPPDPHTTGRGVGLADLVGDLRDD